MRAAEVMRYYSASAGDLRSLRVDLFFKRFSVFSEIHKDDMKVRAHLAGLRV